MTREEVLKREDWTWAYWISKSPRSGRRYNVCQCNPVGGTPPLVLSRLQREWPTTKMICTHIGVDRLSPRGWGEWVCGDPQEGDTPGQQAYKLEAYRRHLALLGEAVALQAS